MVDNAMMRLHRILDPSFVVCVVLESFRRRRTRALSQPGTNGAGRSHAATDRQTTSSPMHLHLHGWLLSRSITADIPMHPPQAQE